MNLANLFEMQAALDTHIEHEHPKTENENRLEKKVLALLVELGELANEFRGFKFWSNDQEPRTWKRINCPSCKKKGYERGKPPVDTIKGTHALGNHWYYCDECAGHLVIDINPMLVEYVDCLHFILSIGNEIGINEYYADEVNFNIGGRTICTDLIKNFIEVNKSVMKLLTYEKSFAYHNLISNFMTLGDSLGFTEEQIEQAYIKKNEINHQRQLSGY